MKTLSCLFNFVLAVMLCSSMQLSAQTITSTKTGVYIMNSEAKTFLSRGNAWGTAAVMDEFGIPVNISYYSDGTCSISFVDTDGKLGSNPSDIKEGETEWAWTDFSSPTYYKVTASSSSAGETYTFKSSTGLLFMSENSNDNGRIANGGVKNVNYTSEASVTFSILTREQHDAMVEQNRMEMLHRIAMKDGKDFLPKNMDEFESYLDGFEYKADITFDVEGALLADYSLTGGWTSVNTKNDGNAYTINPDGSEFYQSANFFRKQITGLTPGVYKLTLRGFMRQGSAEKCLEYKDYDFSYAYLGANGCKENLKPWASDRATDSDPNSMQQALYLFSNGKYLNTLYTYVGKDGILNIEIACPGYANNRQWVDFRVLTLTAYTHTYVRNYPEKGEVHHYGDVNKDGEVNVNDVTLLVEALKNNKVNQLADAQAADVNKDGKVTKADVDLLGTIITESAYKPFYDYEVHDVTVYVNQENAENKAGTNYMVNSTINVDRKDVNLKGEVLKLKINLQGFSDVMGVSIYSKSKKSLAGQYIYNTSIKNYDMQTIPYSMWYDNGMESDVVFVSTYGSDKEVIAYLLPEGVKNGITVTVRSNNSFYSKDFELNNLVEDEITFNISASKQGAWMATIPGDIHFNYLTLPGAHDAATSSVSYEKSKCQSMDISNLLKAGVRSLDLRPKGVSNVTADNMMIYHGITNTNVLFKDALNSVVSFLKEYPTETVFILIHDEAEKTSTAWQKAVLTCIENVQDYVKVIDNNMLLDDCRGKMVIISRDNVGTSNLLGKCGWGSSFNNKTVFYGSDSNSKTPWTLVYQDEYDTNDTDKRISQVIQLLDNHIKKNEFNNKYIFYNTTNIAGSIFGKNPCDYAPNMNFLFDDSSASSIRDWEGRLGIISGDFMGDANYNGDSFLNSIINQNYKYVFKGRSRVGL